MDSEGNRKWNCIPVKEVYRESAEMWIWMYFTEIMPPKHQVNKNIRWLPVAFCVF